MWDTFTFSHVWVPNRQTQKFHNVGNGHLVSCILLYIYKDITNIFDIIYIYMYVLNMFVNSPFLEETSC